MVKALGKVEVGMSKEVYWSSIRSMIHLHTSSNTTEIYRDHPIEGCDSFAAKT